MGLYAITTALIQRLKREHWGAQMSQDKLSDKEMHDTGVQDFVDEFLAGLTDASATQMPETWKLVAPRNGPAISINQGDNVDGGIVIINENNEEITLNFETINNITEIINTVGVTGDVSVLTDVSVDVSSSGSISISGCSGTVTITNTVTVTKTFATLSFTNGVLTVES